MTDAEFRDAIRHLGLTQVGAARFLGVNETTSRRWASGRTPVPPVVGIVLRVMVRKGLMPDEVASLAKH